MAQPTTNHLTDRLRSELGENTNWTSPSDVNAALWTFPGYELICAEQLSSKSGINRLWAERWNNRAIPVILIATSDVSPKRVNVLGPDEAHRSMRELPAQQIVELLRDIRDCNQHEAHERLTNELAAMTDSITPRPAGQRTADHIILWATVYGSPKTPHHFKMRSTASALNT